jgi:glutathione synthase/RimK-type ligase-like ATP-grasp enzyme
MISENEALERALELHPELDSWEDSDYERAESESGVNWRLHLELDAVVLRRASDDSLPDTRVIRELERRGQSRGAAVHKIAMLVAEDLWERMKEASETGNSEEVSAEAECDFEARNKKLNDRIVALVGRSQHRGMDSRFRI